MELLIDYKAKNDKQVPLFSEEKNRLRNGEKPNIQLYGKRNADVQFVGQTK